MILRMFKCLGEKKVIFMGFAFLGCVFSMNCFAQCPQKEQIWNSIIQIEMNASLSDAEKLQQVLPLKIKYEKCQYEKDSVYARLLHRISNLKYKINNEVATNEVLDLTLQSIRINTSGQKGSAPYFAVASYRNLGIYYQSLDLNRKALDIYDSVINLSGHFNDTMSHHKKARYGKVLIFRKIGDYQKCVEESTIGINEAIKSQDGEMEYSFKNQRAQAYCFQSQIRLARTDADFAFQNASKNNDLFEIAMALKTEALLYAKENENAAARNFFEKAITARIKTGDYGQVAADYADLGNFFIQNEHYQEAKNCYLYSIGYANKGGDFPRLAIAHVNLGLMSTLLHKYDAASRYYLLAFRDLKLASGDNILVNPIARQFNLIGNKELVQVILGNKTELLLKLYKRTGEKKYLDACLQTAMVTDSVITQTRYGQSTEQGKLYWRNRTREFFTNAIEASYLAGDPGKAFYFMEKAQAVLLNDKLNELGASNHLPLSETMNEQRLRVRIMEEQQKLEALVDSGYDYKNQQNKLGEAKGDLDRFIKSLEQKYPVYYQYKYDDKVPLFDSLQHYLTANNQSFIHYFISDTATYILCITPATTKFIKLFKKDFSIDRLQLFLQYCSNKENLNSHYPSFISVSYSLYKLLFQPLQISKGRVIICPNNFLIPFEALCTDNTGKNFLVNDYAFSYVYSARYLLKKFISHEAKGNFIGFAPVVFQSYLHLNELKQSSVSLEKCAAYYNNSALFLNINASRSNFLQSIADYDIVNIFSHASADTAGNEPLLYMQDSIIKLSELQVLSNAATTLVVLSACETNVGKNATGEGIYSLARGFAAAGIPSIAATLWSAEDRSIYAITEKFHEYISQGFPKDEALQKAKLYFMNNAGAENQLPYYWSNIILTGNAGSVKLSSSPTITRTQLHLYRWGIGSAIIILLLLISIIYYKKLSASKHLPDR